MSVLFWHCFFLFSFVKSNMFTWLMCVRARVYWTSIANLFARQKYEQKRTETENCDWNDSGDGGGGASGTFDWDPFIWRYLWCFHLKIIRSAAPVFFIVSSAVHAFWQRHQLLIVIISATLTISNVWFSVFFVVIIFYFAQSHRAFNFCRSHTRRSNDALLRTKQRKTRSIVRGPFGIDLTFFTFHLRNYIINDFFLLLNRFLRNSPLPGGNFIHSAQMNRSSKIIIKRK